ncbi:hypothetical protein BDR26DRAFT_869642, partial [Obelidium mucronatum]
MTALFCLFHLLALVSSTLSVSVLAPKDDSVYLPNATVHAQFHVTNALSSGSKDIYVYLEPGHSLLHELHRQFPFINLQTVSMEVSSVLPTRTTSITATNNTVYSYILFNTNSCSK